MGYEVDAVELVQSNIDNFRERIKSNQKINIYKGNALDLSIFQDNTYDITLLLGPMYHLFNEEDKIKALSEAIRVTKTKGIVFVAYCISDPTLLEAAFKNKKFDISNYIKLGKINPNNFETFSKAEDIFELVRKEDIDNLMKNFKVERLHYLATDLLAKFIKESLDEMTEEEFKLFMKYHLFICERQDMVGLSHHTLDIFRKV